MKLININFLFEPVLKFKKTLLVLLILPFLSFQLNSTRNFTLNDGLIDNSIIDIAQDKFGQLWVITGSSVSVFNGSHWKNFSTKFQHPENPFNSFLQDYKRILIDDQDNKFFLSRQGKIFQLQKNSFNELVSPFQSKGILFSEIQLVNEENRKTLWASTENNGLAYFENTWFSFNIEEGLISNKIKAIKSSGEWLLVLTDKGIQFIKNRRVVYTFSTNEIEKYDFISTAFDKYSKTKDNIPAIWILAGNKLMKLENEKLQDLSFKFFNPFREHYTLVYTNGGNKLFLANKNLVKIVNPITGEMQILSKEVGIIGSPQVLFVDDERNLWIGTDKGLTRINFTNIRKFTDEDGLSETKIFSSLKVGKDFYFGHSNGKITIYSNSKFYQLNYQFQLNFFLNQISKKNLDIVKLSSLNNKIIFQVGGWGIFEIQSRQSIKPIFIIQNSSDYLSDFQVTDDGGLILCGKFSVGKESKNLLTINSLISVNQEALLKQNISKIFISRDGSIFLVVDKTKVFKLSRNKVEEVSFPNENNSKITLIREDRGSNIFIGTENGFFVLMKNGEVKSYLQNNSENGRGNYEIYSFYFDDLNNVWLMTNKGLRFWNWKEFKFSSEWKGIIPSQSNESAIDEIDKKIYVTAENGLFIFPSDEDEIREISPRVYISEIFIDGKTYDSFTEIKLKEIKDLKISFNAVLLSGNNNIEFSYKLEGFDSDWSNPTNAREIRYANLPDGEYKFLVRVRTNYSSWSIPVSSNLIKIRKPFYYHYHYLIIFVLSVIIVLIIIYTQKTKKELKEKNFKNVQLQIQGLEKQNKQLRQEINKALELSKSRMTFLASLSHELRTPINSIIGFIDILLDSKLNLTEEEKTKYLNYISVNSRRLLILINDIIDLAKIDSGTISLEYSEVNLNAEVRDTINLFREKIKQKQLDLILELDPDLETKFLYADRNRLHQIISNLITNAIKFTEEGFIKISTRKEADNFILSVEDTGIGIPEGEINFIFEEFRRASTAIRKSIEGTGLGLSITKRLVELMKGEIKVESQEGIGTTFTVIFPANKNLESKSKREINTTLN